MILLKYLLCHIIFFNFDLSFLYDCIQCFLWKRIYEFNFSFQFQNRVIINEFLEAEKKSLKQFEWKCYQKVFFLQLFLVRNLDRMGGYVTKWNRSWVQFWGENSDEIIYCNTSLGKKGMKELKFFVEFKSHGSFIWSSSWV